MDILYPTKMVKMDTYYPLFCLITGIIDMDKLDHLSIINLFRLVILLIDLPGTDNAVIEAKTK